LDPGGRGFITVPNPERYPLLPAPIKDKSVPDSWGIAVFHQIHCLASDANLVMMNFLSLSRTGNLESSDHWDHIFHCFDYLREVVMCHGDTSLEGQDLPTEISGTHGQLVTHNCKAYDEIFTWAEDHRLTDVDTLGKAKP
ncbi:hypothetical protein FB567DRAFT_453419, partial [Paraphoma chrysanthemicola]